MACLMVPLKVASPSKLTGLLISKIFNEFRNLQNDLLEFHKRPNPIVTYCLMHIVRTVNPTLGCCEVKITGCF
jgi:hypothetical protein